jgi:ATP-dependent Clp protease adaptor protein ClpS
MADYIIHDRHGPFRSVVWTMSSLRSACEQPLHGGRLGGPGEPPGGPPAQPPGRGNDNGNGEGEGRSGALTPTRTRTKKPSMYKVLMLNDDYTPMEFVVDVLQHIFQKNREEATQIMLHVHQKGVGICGVYTYEIAETKVTQTVDYARKNQHPLQCTLEKE